MTKLADLEQWLDEQQMNENDWKNYLHEIIEGDKMNFAKKMKKSNEIFAESIEIYEQLKDPCNKVDTLQAMFDLWQTNLDLIQHEVDKVQEEIKGKINE